MILAVDCGSTSFKAAVFDRRLKMKGEGAAALSHDYPAAGRVELDVEGAALAFGEAVGGALRAASTRASSLLAVAVTSQAQTFTVRDGSGRAKMRYISWQDQRAGAACAALRETPSLADFGRHASFGSPLAALQICQIMHLRRTRPGFIRPDDMVLKLPADFVRQLTGEAVLDENLAAMSGLYSLVRRAWWPAALKAGGLRPGQLPRLVPVGAVAAVTSPAAKRLGLPAGVPVVLAGNDQTAGACGARLDKNDAVLLTLGTAHVAYACLGRMPAPRPGLVRGPYPGGRAYRLAVDGCGGNVLNWARTVLAGCGSEEEFFGQAAGSVRGARGLVFEPDLDSGCGAWRNIGLHHTTADLARAVVEALGRRLATLVKDLGVDPRRRRVLAAGGGSRNAFFLQAVSAALGAPVRAISAGPLLGAARMALEAVRSGRGRP